MGKRDRRRRRRRIRNVIFAAATLAVAGYGLWLALGPAAELAGVERPRDRGRGHVAAATFPSATPTSGPHSAQSPACRVYSEPLPLDLAVHGLEHGAVVLWYDADQPSLAAELVSVTSRWDSHVIISPAAELESPVVATAWRRKKAYLDVNEDLVDFIDIYRRRGPERVPCA